MTLGFDAQFYDALQLLQSSFGPQATGFSYYAERQDTAATLVNSSCEFDICKGTIHERVGRGAPADLDCTLLADWSTTEPPHEAAPYAAPADEKAQGTWVDPISFELQVKQDLRFNCAA